MAAALPPIETLTACPHCGGGEFYVNVRYSGRGVYYRRFDGCEGADNSQMYDAVNAVESKTAHCGTCERPVARWDESTNGRNYNKRPGV